MKNIIALILILSISANCLSKDVDILIWQSTFHLRPRYDGKEFNENNPLIGIDYQSHSFFIMKNSYDNFSFVAIKNKKIDVHKNLRFHASYGLSTGYENHMPDISAIGLTPVAYIGVDIHPSSDDFGLLINYTPTVFVGVGLRFRL